MTGARRAQIVRRKRVVALKDISRKRRVGEIVKLQAQGSWPVI